MKKCNVVKVKMGGNVETAGTYRVSQMPNGTKYKSIVKVFGKPQYTDPEGVDKVKAEWEGKINGVVFTIYDYKTGRDIEQNTQWSIGGYGASVGEGVLEYFNNKK